MLRVFLLLAATSIFLVACETTQTRQLSALPPISTPARVEKPVLVVRSELVPDDDEIVFDSRSKPQEKRIAGSKTVRSSVVPDEPEDPVTTNVPATPPSSDASPPAAETAEVAPTAEPSAATTADMSDTAPIPPAIPATTAKVPKNDAPAWPSFSTDQFLQASIGGMPLWLVVLLTVLGMTSLIVAFSGRRQAEAI